ncbi:MAG: hypothetical protein NVSMB25_14600 [Thermoleophilaceae bacterium]
MAENDDRDDLVLEHPNRDKATSKATKTAVALLLLASAGLVAVVTIGGWSTLEGAQIVNVVYVIVYCVMAYFVARWSRGMLPLAAGLAVILLVFAAIATPGWFARDHSGFEAPLLPAGLIGMLTLIIIPVQILLVAFALRGFSQEWNIEVEVPREEANRRNRRGNGGGPGGARRRPQPQG